MTKWRGDEQKYNPLAEAIMKSSGGRFRDSTFVTKFQGTKGINGECQVSCFRQWIGFGFLLRVNCLVWCEIRLPDT